MRLFTVLYFFGGVSAHAVFNSFFINGKQNDSCIRAHNNNSPVTDVRSNDMRCNRGGAVGVPGVCSVQAGDTIAVQMHQQPNDHACKPEAIGGRHFGPVMIYMCEVSDAKSSNGDCSWVKVAEDSYAGTEASWGTVSIYLIVAKAGLI
jgi:cellulase